MNADEEKSSKSMDDEQHGHAVAPVTIDNGESIYARAYLGLLELGDRQQQRKLRAE